MADDTHSPEWGTIFSQGREHTLGGIEHARSTVWTPEDEEAYLTRIKDKATQMAASMLEEARLEAENIRRTAHEEGYNQGLADAQGELENFQSGMADSVAAVLSAIEGQSAEIFASWREELVAVARLAVEKVTSIELEEKNKAILESILVEAVGALEKRRELVIRVNPEDEPVISDIISFTQAKFPDVKAWRVRADKEIQAGGMVVESESSLAEGRVESRRAAVEEVLAHLQLPG